MKNLSITLLLICFNVIGLFAQDALQIDKAGNIGIGIGIPLTKLHLFDGEFALGRIDGREDHTPYARFGLTPIWEQYMANNAYYNITENRFDFVNPGFDNGRASLISQQGGSIYFKTANNKVNPVNFLNRLTIYNDGNIGIGNDIPQAKLDVNGDLRAGRATFDDLQVNSRSTLSQGAEISGLTHFYHNTPDIPPLSIGGLYISWNKHVGQGETNFTNTAGPYGYRPGFTFDVIDHRSVRTELMTIRDGGTENDGRIGRVGINNENPDFPLQVDGYGVSDPRSNKFMENGNRFKRPNGEEVGEGRTGKPISIYAQYGIQAGYSLFISSDRRIKKTLITADNATDLDLLNQFKVTSFQYIDTTPYGNSFNKGFIAQEVEEIYPQAVNTGTQFIPDVFSSPEHVSIINNRLTVVLKSDHGLVTGDVVRVMMANKTTKDVPVTVLNNKQFTVANWTETDDKLFIYGKRVNDFKTVDYQQIFSLNVSATQQLSKEIEKLKAENETLKAQNSKLEKKVTASIDALSSFEARLKSLESKQVTTAEIAIH